MKQDRFITRTLANNRLVGGVQNEPCWRGVSGRSLQHPTSESDSILCFHHPTPLLDSITHNPSRHIRAATAEMVMRKIKALLRQVTADLIDQSSFSPVNHTYSLFAFSEMNTDLLASPSEASFVMSQEPIKRGCHFAYQSHPRSLFMISK